MSGIASSCPKLPSGTDSAGMRCPKAFCGPLSGTATPITFGALVLEAPKVPHDLPAATLAIGVATSALFGVLAIRLLLGMLPRTGFGVFFAYRALLAAGIVAWWLARR